MKKLIDAIQNMQDRNSKELSDMGAEINKLTKAIENDDASLNALPQQTDWMTLDDLKLKEVAIKKGKEQHLADRYRMSLKHIKAETIITVMNNHMRDARIHLEAAATSKFPWN